MIAFEGPSVKSADSRLTIKPLPYCVICHITLTCETDGEDKQIEWSSGNHVTRNVTTQVSQPASQTDQTDREACGTCPNAEYFPLLSKYVPGAYATVRVLGMRHKMPL